MKTQTIEFHPQMMSQIESGNKTVTRRPVKISNSACGFSPEQCIFDLTRAMPKDCGDYSYLKCPYRLIDAEWMDDPYDDFKVSLHCKYEPLQTLSVKVSNKHKFNIFERCPHKPFDIRVRSVHLERLRDITEEGAIEEGFKSVQEFKQFWNSIYGMNAWDQNPWVWVIKFEVIK